jgi:hypothetical protein
MILPEVAGRWPTTIRERTSHDSQKLTSRHVHPGDGNRRLRGGATGVEEPLPGRIFELLTDQPSVAFSSGSFLREPMTSGYRRVHRRYDAFRLERRRYPTCQIRIFVRTIFRELTAEQ